jgi:hypothetical protein
LQNFPDATAISRVIERFPVIGGLFVAILLTLLFLPALCVAWFRIKEPRREREPGLRADVPAAAK